MILPSHPRRVVVATGNLGKLREFQDLLGDALVLLPQSDFAIESVDETGDSFMANALLKARHAAAGASLPAIADDSGLEVDALNGAPGIYSARYAGEPGDDAANNAKLLAALSDLPLAQRRARFRCAIAWVESADDPAPIIAEGVWDGHIALRAKGQGGFGYDPLFVDPDSGLHSAQLSPAEKHLRSHRGQAIRALRGRLITDG